MNSIWSGAAANSASPFTTGQPTPSPGGAAAARFLSTPGSSGGPASANSSASTGVLGAGATASAAASSAASDSSSTITSNDFLTLLVTEMQNQDPTAQTDPNEYINQLVQINSLEQLISINQNLASVLSTATTTPTTKVDPSGPAAPTTVSSSATSVEAASRGVKAPGHSHTGSVQQGNLSIPAAVPAASVVAHSLDGKVYGVAHGHSIRDIPTR